ncbi:MAG: DoxX family membrane protein [Flavobacteriales bacterium]|nr:DoxX family membrane protein [Flavobacteriales bacterium]
MSQSKAWDYFLLVARFLLAWTLLDYGIGKLVGDQFGISEVEMNTQVGELSLFRLSWYLFDHQPFKAFIGISQVVCALLLLLNRTAILGALMSIPILLNILIIDLTIMPPGLMSGFTWRLSSYLILNILILWHYRDRMRHVWYHLTDNVRTKFGFPLWAYLMLPIMAILLEVMLIIPQTLANLILRPAATIDAWSKLPELIRKALEHFQ